MVKLYFLKLRNKKVLKKTNISSNVVNKPIKLATRFLYSTYSTITFIKFFNSNIKQQNLKKKKKKKLKHTRPKKSIQPVLLSLNFFFSGVNDFF